MIITHRLPGITRGLLPVSIVIGSLAGAPGASAEQYRYYCDALKVYYPMVTSCEAGWRRVPVASRGLRHPEKPGGPLAEPPLPTPAPRPQVTREEMPSPVAAEPAPPAATPAPDVAAGRPGASTGTTDDRPPAPAPAPDRGYLIVPLSLFVAAGATALLVRRRIAQWVRRPRKKGR